MNCSVCGTMIPDGQTNCPNCGAMAQPMQPNMAQPMQPNMAQPMQPNMAQPMQPNMAQPMQPNMGQPMQPNMGQPMQPNMGQPMGGYQQPMGGYQQPMGGYQQPMGGYQQPMGGYQQPMGGGANLNGFINSLKADYMKLIGFIGAFLIFIAPFFNWMSLKYKEKGEKAEKETMNMFKLGSDADQAIITICAILLLVVGLALILWDLADYVPALGALKAKVMGVPYIELILVGVALLAFILVMVNGEVNDAIEAGDKLIEMYKEWDDDVSGHCNHGLGPVVLILGILAAGAPKIMKTFKFNFNVSKR